MRKILSCSCVWFTRHA